MPQPKLHTDIPRLRAGDRRSVLVGIRPRRHAGSSAVRATLEQIDVVHRMVRKYPDTFELARTAADVERIFKTGRIASLIGMEGEHSIDNSLATLRMFEAAGARYMTLTHSTNVRWADSGTDKPKLGGLSKFGEESCARSTQHAGRFEPHVARHDARRHSGKRSTDHLFSLRCACAQRPWPQCPGRCAEAAADQRRDRHGDIRAGLSDANRESNAGRRRQSHGC